MNGTILNIAMTILSIGLVIIITKKKNLSYKNDIGLIFPKWTDLIFWIVLFVLLITLEDYVAGQFSGSKAESWDEKYTKYEQIIRGIGIVILAPIAEELVFRGILYWRIKNSRLKHIGAILLPAILFSLIHIQYAELLTLTIIFIDGLFYGLARHISKSVVLTIVLHSLSNLGAVLERIL